MLTLSTAVYYFYSESHHQKVMQLLDEVIATSAEAIARSNTVIASAIEVSATAGQITATARKMSSEARKLTDQINELEQKQARGEALTTDEERILGNIQQYRTTMSS